MSVTRSKANGAIIVSDVIDGYLVTEKYIGYSKKEAISEFKKEYK